MPQVAKYNMNGETAGVRELSDFVFGAEIRPHIMHAALIRQLAGWRAGNAATKTRDMVSGGGKKPWRQKGTGRARHGSTRSPIWTGGGTVFGPHPRSYSIGMPRKVRRLALRSALSSRVIDGGLIVLNELTAQEPKTSVMARLLGKLEANGKVLIVLPGHNGNVEKSLANISGVKTILVDNLNVFDILNSDRMILTDESVDRVEEAFAL